MKKKENILIKQKTIIMKMKMKMKIIKLIIVKLIVWI